MYLVLQLYVFLIASGRPGRPYNIYLVFEYMEHDMHGLIDKRISFEPSQVKCIMIQLLEALRYLHENGVMHRDIKGANILMSNRGEVKLADFGLARRLDRPDGLYTNRVVTLWYRSPELLLGSNKYNAAVDMWSVGCFLAELLTLRPLFPADKEAKVLELIYEKCGSPSEQNWPGVTSLKYFGRLGPKKAYGRRLREEFKGSAK